MTAATKFCSVCGCREADHPGFLAIGPCDSYQPPKVSAAATVRAFAEHVIADVDTHGDPRIYELAEDYLQLRLANMQLRRAIGDALRAMPAVSATYEAFEILSKADRRRAST